MTNVLVRCRSGDDQESIRETARQRAQGQEAARQSPSDITAKAGAQRYPNGTAAGNRAVSNLPLPYRSLMAPATRNADDGHARIRRNADDGPSQAACHADDAFQRRLAASMKRHRRILDRLAHKSG